MSNLCGGSCLVYEPPPDLGMTTKLRQHAWVLLWSSRRCLSRAELRSAREGLRGTVLARSSPQDFHADLLLFFAPAFACLVSRRAARSTDRLMIDRGRGAIDPVGCIDS